MHDREYEKLKAFRRDPRGQGLLSLMMLFALIIFPMFAVLGFEFGRLYLAKQELQSASDAAALTGTATLASSDNTNPTQAHLDAIESALKIFKANTALGVPFTSATVVASKAALTCNVGESKLFFEFLNPVTYAVEPLSSPNGKVVKITASTGSELAFGKFLGIKSWGVNAVSTSAVPKLDMVVCFDVSGSMDDQTPVTFVKRVWDETLGTGKIVYKDVVGVNGVMKGKIYDIMKPGAMGTSLNAVQPQLLTDAYYNSKAYFSEYLASYYGTKGLRSNSVYPEAGAPPGNCPPGTAFTFDGFRCFTDEVVNIDGKDFFGGFVYDGYSFPDVATLVEASRGNLENDVVFKSSRAYTSVSVTPRPGYQKAYFEAAAKQIRPLIDAKDAVLTMNQILNTDADTHFGFAAFDSEVGTAPSSTVDWHNIDDAAPYGAIQPFPLPRVVISKIAGTTQFNEVNTSIKSCVAMGATNIGAAIHAATQDLKANARQGSVKAIILFTDGQPTAPGGPLDADPKANARKAAVAARDAGIAIYTVGLAQNAAIIPDQKAILNDDNPDPTTGGIAAIAGNGGTFNLVTDATQLRTTFAKIARRLVKLVSNR